MKKISSKHNLIKFNVDSQTKLEITSDGIITSDEVASFVHKRLGDANVIIEDVNLDEVINVVLETEKALDINDQI